MRLNGWGAISLGFIGLVFVVTLGKYVHVQFLCSFWSLLVQSSSEQKTVWNTKMCWGADFEKVFGFLCLTWNKGCETFGGLIPWRAGHEFCSSQNPVLTTGMLADVVCCSNWISLIASVTALPKTQVCSPFTTQSEFTFFRAWFLLASRTSKAESTRWEFFLFWVYSHNLLQYEFSVVRSFSSHPHVPVLCPTERCNKPPPE